MTNDLQRRAWLDLVTRHLGDVTQAEALACLAMLEEATPESRGELRASERQGGDEGREVWVVHTPAGNPCDVRLSQTEAEGAVANPDETVVRYTPSQPAPAMTRWVPGTGSELPDGTTGFVAWKAVNGYGVEFSYRRDGGWGSREALNPDEDEPAWADDGDPEFAAKEASVFGRFAITHYMLFALPAPPEVKP